MKRLMLIILFLPIFGYAQIINTIAGTSTAGHSGDGGLRSAAQLNFPKGLAFDDTGNLYIADANNNAIRKISVNGIITTIAGANFNRNYRGDGGPAVKADLNSPTSVTVDDTGNIYFVDWGNFCVRKIDTAGIITTVPTSYSFSEPEHITVDHQGNLYVGRLGQPYIYKRSPAGVETIFAGQYPFGAGYSGDGGPATASKIYGAAGIIADDTGNIYFLDDHRIRKISTSGIITTIAGTGIAKDSGDGGLATKASFQSLEAIAIDKVGNIYASSYFKIRKISASGYISTIAGGDTSGFAGDGGPAINALFFLPMALSTDIAGNLYIGDTYNSRLREIFFCSIHHITSPPKDTEVAEMASAHFSINDDAGFGKYQWQENDGSGFKNVSYGGVYSGVNSKILRITTALSTMNNFQYRCIRTQDDCTDTSIAAKLIIDRLAVNTISEGNTISIFPNPFHDKLLITAPFTMKTIELIDILGNRVLSNTFNSVQTQINVESLLPGYYFIRINKQYLKKIVKK